MSTTILCAESFLEMQVYPAYSWSYAGVLGGFMKILRWLDSLINTLLRISIILITITVITSMALQVCTRYFLPLPIYGLDEFTGHTAVWFYFLGAAYSAAHGEHIKADMLELFNISHHGQYLVSLFSSSVSVVIAGVMVVWSYKYLLWSIARNELTPSLKIPTAYFQVAILVGAVLMFIYFIKELCLGIFYKQDFVSTGFESLTSNK